MPWEEYLLLVCNARLQIIAEKAFIGTVLCDPRHPDKQKNSEKILIFSRNCLLRADRHAQIGWVVTPCGRGLQKWLVQPSRAYRSSILPSSVLVRAGLAARYGFQAFLNSSSQASRFEQLAHEAELRQAGLRSLSLFGSVARDRDRSGQDHINRDRRRAF
jgi:hypothetical protein